MKELRVIVDVQLSDHKDEIRMIKAYHTIPYFIYTLDLQSHSACKLCWGYGMVWNAIFCFDLIESRKFLELQ